MNSEDTDNPNVGVKKYESEGKTALEVLISNRNFKKKSEYLLTFINNFELMTVCTVYQ